MLAPPVMRMRQLGTSVSGYFAEAVEFVNKFANIDTHLEQATCESRQYIIRCVTIQRHSILVVVALCKRGITNTHARSNYVAKMATPSDIRSL